MRGLSIGLEVCSYAAHDINVAENFMLYHGRRRSSNHIKNLVQPARLFLSTRIICKGFAALLKNGTTCMNMIPRPELISNLPR